eukprot:10989-Heterococcus_DN1.PRE.1
MKRGLSLLDHLESLDASFSVNDEEAAPLPLESMLSEIQKRAHQSTSLTIHTICAGSTSNVFASVDLKTLRLIAMKEINMHLQELDSTSFLLREVKGLEMQRSPIFSGGSASSPSAGTASSTEASPHIVQFYGAVREGEGVAMAVEYMAGGSLENWIADRHALPEPWLANIAWQQPVKCTGPYSSAFWLNTPAGYQCSGLSSEAAAVTSREDVIAERSSSDDSSKSIGKHSSSSSFTTLEDFAGTKRYM